MFSSAFKVRNVVLAALILATQGIGPAGAADGNSVPWALPAPSSFDPIQAVEKGSETYARSQEALQFDRAELKALQSEIKDMQSRLVALEPQSQVLTDILRKCSNEIGADFADTYGDEAHWLEGGKLQMDEAFASLKSDAEQYLKIQGCSQCDPKVRDQKLSALRVSIEVIQLPKIKVDLIDRQVELNRVLNKKWASCGLERFFVYKSDSNDYRAWTACSYWSESHQQYCPTLTPAQLLSGTYSKALNYIIDKGPIRVVGTLSSTLPSISGFKDGEIKMRLKFASPLEGVIPADLVNPIEIIQRDLSI